MRANRFHTISGLHLPTFTVAELDRLQAIAKEFGLGRMRFTPNNQLAVSGFSNADLDALQAALGRIMQPLPDNGIAAILACPGCDDCRHGRRDTAAMAERLRTISLPKPMPGRVKIGIAGCSRSCTMPRLRDVGLFPGKQGWSVSFGGNGGSNPRIGDIIATGLDDQAAQDLVQICLVVYQVNAKKKMRTGRFIESFGLDNFLATLAARS